jgi:hypothetical protein
VSIQDVIESRHIEEVVHFTWHRGLLGALHSGFVKSRQRLPNVKELAFIYKPNAQYRKDVQWLDYVNLSITRINYEFFGHSCRWRRDEDLWWCVLSFDPVIATHPGVWFTTTNNIYPATRRGTGEVGLRQLIAEQVLGRYSAVTWRTEQMPSQFTTCEQAEVLYPRELSLEFLRKIYVSTGDDHDEVKAQLAALRWRPVPVIIAPERLGGYTEE